MKSRQANVAMSAREESEFAETKGISALDALKQDVAALTEMVSCHQFAKKALSILSYLTEKWDVDIEIEAGEVSPQECIEICWPYIKSLRTGPPPTGTDNVQAGAGFEGEDPSSHRVPPPMDRAISETIQHPLFKPLLELRQLRPTDRNTLRQAGFYMPDE
jgi:hypothetical protein